MDCCRFAVEYFDMARDVHNGGVFAIVVVANVSDDETGHDAAVAPHIVVQAKWVVQSPFGKNGEAL